MSRLTQSRFWPARRQRAFTLIEIAVVVVILGLLIAMTLPAYRRVNLKSRATAATNDLRSFAASFANYQLQNGSWPAGGTGPGVIPPEMTSTLTGAFTKPTPLGGQYEWVSNSKYNAIGITVDGNSDMELLELADSMLDDGDVSTVGKGSMFIDGPDLVYIIEANK